MSDYPNVLTCIALSGANMHSTPEAQDVSGTFRNAQGARSRKPVVVPAAAAPRQLRADVLPLDQEALEVPRGSWLQTLIRIQAFFCKAPL